MSESEGDSSVSKEPKESESSSAASESTETKAAIEEVTKAIEKVVVEDESLPGMRSGLNMEDYRNELTVIQADPKSPIYSVKSFGDLALPEALLKGVVDGMKFNKPSRIQETALPIILSNPPTNLLAQSQNGTGKTAAFTLGMLSRCGPERTPQALCLANTHELADQNANVARKMAQFSDLQVFVATPRGDKAPAKGAIEAQVIVGTPGKISEYIQKGKLKLNKLRVFVLDEADKMLEGHGLGQETKKIRSKCPEDVQVLLFSATFNDIVMPFVNDLLAAKPHATIRLENSELAIKRIKQLFIDCKSEAQKYQYLQDIYLTLTISQSIIFANSKETVNKLAADLHKDLGLTITTMSGGLDNSVRAETMKSFYAGETKTLIATDLASRGIDNIQVTLVVNYDVPERVEPHPRGGTRRTGEVDAETYYHRIGRAGRFGREGLAITLVHDEKTIKQVKDGAAAIGAQLEEFTGEIQDLVPLLQKMDLKTN